MFAGNNKFSIIQRGEATVKIKASTSPSYSNSTGFVANCILQTIPYTYKDALQRDNPLFVDVDLRISLLQTSKVERDALLQFIDQEMDLYLSFRREGSGFDVFEFQKVLINFQDTVSHYDSSSIELYSKIRMSYQDWMLVYKEEDVLEAPIFVSYPTEVDFSASEDIALLIEAKGGFNFTLRALNSSGGVIETVQSFVGTAGGWTLQSSGKFRKTFAVSEKIIGILYKFEAFIQGQSDPSPAAEIFIASLLPVPAFVNPPAQGLLIYNQNYTWSWDSVPGMTGSDFEYKYQNLPPVIVSKNGITNRTHILNDFLLPEGSFSVRVRVRNSQVSSRWTAPLNYGLRERDYNLSTGSVLQILQGSTGTIGLNVGRPEGGSDYISIYNLNPNALPRVEFVPNYNNPPNNYDGTAGSSISRNVVVGAIDRGTYFPVLNSNSPFNTIQKQLTYSVTVRDIVDEFSSNVVLWLRAEDLSLTDLDKVLDWNYSPRLSSLGRKFRQATVANQPQYLSGNNSSNPFRNITTPFGVKSYPSVLFTQTSRMRLVNLSNANQNLDAVQLSIYIVMAMQSSPGATRRLMVDVSNVSFRSITSFTSVGTFFSGFDYGSSQWSFQGLGSGVRGCWSARWTNNGTSVSQASLRRNTDSDTVGDGPESNNVSFASIWRLNQLGGTTDTGNNSTFPYYLAELIIVDQNLSSDNDAKILDYINAKYGIGY